MIKRTVSGGKAKVLSKRPSRTFISIKLRVRFKAIHHYLDEQGTLPTAMPPTARASSVVSFSGLVRTLVSCEVTFFFLQCYELLSCILDGKRFTSCLYVHQLLVD